MAENLTNQAPSDPEQDKAAEELSNASQDKVDSNKDQAKKMADDAPKSADDYDTDERMGSAPAARKVLQDKKKKSKEKGGKKEKFEIDLDNYMAFVDRVTSKASKNFPDLIDRYKELHDAKCNISRLDTAASGMCSEAGEFMEIVKKLKFQGKPYNRANKEHLEKELGDIMWYVAQAALALDVRLDEVIYTNTLKLAARYPNQMFEVGYSENRAPGDI